jgi:adenylate cyclase
MRISPRAQVRLIPFLLPGATILAAGAASAYSLGLGLIVLFLTPAVLIPLGHNFEPFGARRREEDDGFLFESCDSGMVSRFRDLYRKLPSNPRCRVCLVPFGGVGRLLRISPSRKNPNFCSSCIDSSPEGVHDREVGVLFADIRGFTAWSSSQPTSVVAERVSRFYDLASRVLMRDDALVEFVGDQVMALYLPDFPSLRERTADVMLSAAERLVNEVQLDQGSDPLRIGVGMNFGVASIGNVRKGGQRDFTAVGDVVNTAARLQGAAGPGEIVIADAVFEKLEAPPEPAERRLLEVKGKAEALPVHVLPSEADA